MWHFFSDGVLSYLIPLMLVTIRHMFRNVKQTRTSYSTYNKTMSSNTTTDIIIACHCIYFNSKC
ncbi:hypothetical protein, partial [Francisella tularensis]|uniref:hypothetical protein n=1 Tax=Francisella tularensis TaxID=263 RepID=UPI001CD37029